MRALGGTGSHPVNGKVGVRRGEDHLVIRAEDNHFKAVVSDERVVQKLRNAFEIVLRFQLRKGVSGQLHLARQNFHVLLLEVLFHRRCNHEPEHK